MDVDSLMAGVGYFKPTTIKMDTRVYEAPEPVAAPEVVSSGAVRDIKPAASDTEGAKTSTDSGIEKPMLKLPSDAAILKAMDKLNRALGLTQRELNISIDERTHIKVVKVIDSSTKEVIRTIPPEQTIEFIANVLEMTGVLVNKSN